MFSYGYLGLAGVKYKVLLQVVRQEYFLFVVNLVSRKSSYKRIILGVVDYDFVVYHSLDLFMLTFMVTIKNVVLIPIISQLSYERINHVLKNWLLCLDLDKLALVYLQNWFFVFKLRLLLRRQNLVLDIWFLFFDFTISLKLYSVSLTSLLVKTFQLIPSREV